MAKKTLEEKIELVCWWALGLTILYFLVGAFLISDGPKFDPTKTYNLLKDTLTLTAAFLAPAFAFVLFSSWKEQYFQTKIEKDAQAIYEDVVAYLSLLNKLERLVQKRVLSEKEHAKALELRDSLRPLSEELYRKINGFNAQAEYKSESGQVFYKKSKDISNYFRSATGGIRTLIGGFEKELDSGNYLQRTPNYDIVLGDDVYENLDELSEGLSTLAVYKSKVVSVIN
ncbi:hypothetical protein KTH93_04465 [Acinetobacter bereziniae]|uniref:hypothetical protein n=1 Tax=Acinetobacter bereziniae TaxID=106648 RepID=UPI0021D23EFA|nr:hypothetical protein [Acinetobacter bereziniae]MCU4434730.1 hypothetical protein [Acinetobacter bereziniae]